MRTLLTRLADAVRANENGLVFRLLGFGVGAEVEAGMLRVAVKLDRSVRGAEA